MALFDSDRAAMVFAINASVDPSIPGPNISKFVGRVAYGQPQEPGAVAGGTKAPGLGLWGLDRIATAALILRKLATLRPEHQVVITGSLAYPTLPCACRAPCCSGARVNPRWAQAVDATCEYLRDTGEVLRAGRRGLSTLPQLRRDVVVHFYGGRTVHTTLADLAARAGVTGVTAARHRDWIVTCLHQTHTDAWAELSPVLHAAGITGEQA
jgi:hypothetical protein